MGKDTKIEWAQNTFNPWIGCQKVGPGCDNCYAEEWDHRFAASVRATRWGAHAERTKTSAQNWRQPIKWNREAQVKHDAWEVIKRAYPGMTDAELIARGFHKPTRPRVFCASLADVFDNAVDQDWRDELFDMIEKTPYLDWLLLTKRIGNVQKMLDEWAVPRYGWDDGWNGETMLPNVWIGITVVNQEEADRDIPKLLQVPAAVRFLSMEPLLGPVDLGFGEIDIALERDGYGNAAILGGIDWVIVGGESGPKARPMVLGWAKNIVSQCRDAGVPVLMKQLGARPTNREGEPHRISDRKGEITSEWPEELRIREYPNAA